MEAVRRLNAIKKMMAAGLTLEDIKGSFVVLKNHIDLADRELAEVFRGLERMLAEPGQEGRTRKDLEAQLEALRQKARQLVEDVARLGSAVTAKTGAAAEPL